MQAHTRAADVGRLRLSNGALLTTADRSGNEAADLLAKAAAVEHRVPPAARGQVASALLLSWQLALLIMQITTIAGALVTPDGTVLRDSDPGDGRSYPGSVTALILDLDNFLGLLTRLFLRLSDCPSEFLLRLLSTDRGVKLRIVSSPSAL